MKTLPKYFIILRDATNPLWDKYIEWIYDTYGESWTGTYQEYYGYDGGKEWKGTNVYDNPKKFINNPTIITLDYWNECVNGVQLPEKWCVKITRENNGIIGAWYNKQCHTACYSSISTERPYMASHTLDPQRESIMKGTSILNCRLKEPTIEFPEITFEQFKKYILKQDNMEKKLIGYKLIKPEMYKVSSIILYGNTSGSEQLKEVVISKSNIILLKKAEVLDLWFEPVYEEEFKVGDWVLLSNNANGWGSLSENVNNKILQITKINSSDKPERGGRYFFGSGITVGQEIVRKATPEEILDSMVKEFTDKTGITVGSTILATKNIKGNFSWNGKIWSSCLGVSNSKVVKFSMHRDNKTLLMQIDCTIDRIWYDAYKMKLADSIPDITIKGYKAEFTKDSVSFGCQTYSKEFVLILAKCLEVNDFDMEIRDEVIEIAEYFKSL